jgi:hypothetical protein
VRLLHGRTGLSVATLVSMMSIAFAGPAAGQSYSTSAELEAKIASHPHVRRLTDWGGRPEWSADSKRLIFVSKEYGDVFEMDVATRKTRPLTFHFPHTGMFRGFYLQNGDILLTAPRNHDPEASGYGRFFESEIWLMKGDLSAAPVPLEVNNHEGVAVARNDMRIAWVVAGGAPPAKQPDRELFSEKSALNNIKDEIWIGDIQYADGKPSVANRRKLLDCAAATGVLAEFNASRGSRCTMLEPQNFVPGDEQRMTFSMVTRKATPNGVGGISSYVLDLRTNKVAALTTSHGYLEVEGVFPDGKYSLSEHYPDHASDGATHKVDLWRLSLDGRGDLRPVTTYNRIDPRLKSNQGVISPDGRWMAFSVSTDEIEAKVPGQGMGLFLMDLKAAGF